ncbi:MAG: hypothetical protein IJU25_06835 [Lachnospiraceae bacterium]|nr:hypothetical protein [Lachnospiraceae bacterium]
MIDIHCHLLYGVDDGAATLEISREMLAKASEQGITDIILTPHYRQGMFPYHTDDIRSSFSVIREEAKQWNIRVYLGCEYHVDDEMVGNLKSGRVHTLAGTDCVLAEFGHASTFNQIRNSLDLLLSEGYTPVIAHAERYDVFLKEPSLLAECRNMGAMVQINADSILGRDGSRYKKACRQILKEELADIVASDAHNTDSRPNNMRKCCNHVANEYGWDLAWKLFAQNPLNILER